MFLDTVTLCPSTCSIMGVIGETLYSLCSTFRTPRFMNVQDLRLGTANIALQIAICVYFVLIMVSFKEYETKFTPDGSAQYFMSKGEMYDVQGSNETTKYCTDAANGDYDYDDIDCDLGDLFWCERDIKCAYPNFAEVSKKLDSSLWTYTYLKDAHVRRGICNSLTCAANEERSEQVIGKPGFGCHCTSKTNTFLTGAEGASLRLAHTYYIPQLDKKEVNVLTRVRKAGFSEIYGKDEVNDKYVLSEDGENTMLTVMQFLALAGIDDLNAPNEEAMIQYPSKIPGQIASYRQTGYEVQLDFNWVGSVGSTIPGGSNVELILSVVGKAGYSSKGNDVSYTVPPSVANNTNIYDQTSEYHDYYYRGIKFGFTFGGTIGYFDMYNLIVVFTSFTILLSVSGTIVSMVAYYLLGYESTVYTNYGQSTVSIKRLHGKVAAQALIASAVWKNVMGMSANEEPGFDRLIEKFKEQGYGVEDSQYLAKALLETSQPDKDKGLEDLMAGLHSMKSAGKGALNYTGLRPSSKNIQVPENLDGDEVAVAPEIEDPFATVRNETMNMTEFCDLISEEQTTLASAMNALGGGELEMDGDLEKTGDKETASVGDVELPPV